MIEQVDVAALLERFNQLDERIKSLSPQKPTATIAVSTEGAEGSVTPAVTELASPSSTSEVVPPAVSVSVEDQKIRTAALMAYLNSESTDPETAATLLQVKGAEIEWNADGTLNTESVKLPSSLRKSRAIPGTGSRSSGDWNFQMTLTDEDVLQRGLTDTAFFRANRTRIMNLRKQQKGQR